MLPQLIILLLSLTACANGFSILISCVAGCGCVTEYGVSVRCDFVGDKELVVLRAVPVSRGQYYTVQRQMEIGTSLSFGQEFSSAETKCPENAGLPPAGNFYCMPAPKVTPTSPVPGPSSGKSEADLCNNLALTVSQDDNKGESTLKVEPRYSRSANPNCINPFARGVAFGCRPRFLRRR